MVVPSITSHYTDLVHSRNLIWIYRISKLHFQVCDGTEQLSHCRQSANNSSFWTIYQQPHQSSVAPCENMCPRAFTSHCQGGGLSGINSPLKFSWSQHARPLNSIIDEFSKLMTATALTVPSKSHFSEHKHTNTFTIENSVIVHWF